MMSGGVDYLIPFLVCKCVSFFFLSLSFFFSCLFMLELMPLICVSDDLGPLSGSNIRGDICDVVFLDFVLGFLSFKPFCFRPEQKRKSRRHSTQ